MIEIEQRLVSGLVVLSVISAVVATAYLWHVYRGVATGLRSRLYGAVAASATLVTVGALMILWPAMLALLGRDRLPQELNLVLVGGGLVLAFLMPTYMANFVRRVRARRKARATALWKERDEA